MTEPHPWLGVEWAAVTAIATAVLVAGIAVTLWGVSVTRKAATADLEATQSQLRASYRPLLIEVLRDGPITPDMEATPNRHGQRGEDMPAVIELNLAGAGMFIDPRRVFVDPSKGYVSVPLRNVGAGLAVLDPDALAVGGLQCEVDETTVDRPRVPPGETTRVNLALMLVEGEEAKRFSVHVPYTDLAGEQRTKVEVYLRRSDNRWEIEHLEHSPTRWGEIREMGRFDRLRRWFRRSERGRR
jgi:hypothetical protein